MTPYVGLMHNAVMFIKYNEIFIKIPLKRVYVSFSDFYEQLHKLMILGVMKLLIVM